MTSGSLWNYYRDEIDDVDDNASDVKSLEYRTKIKGNTSKQETPDRPGNKRDANWQPVPIEVSWSHSFIQIS